MKESLLCGGILGTLMALVTAEPTAMPTSLPTTASLPTPPTNFPTPELPFVYDSWGATSFGDEYQDLYYWSYQHAVRRPGWSWGDAHTGYGPFCHKGECYSVVDACKTLGGVLLHEYYCSFPDDVKIAGPSCWRDDCEATGEAVCDDVNGITVGDDKVQWCIMKGRYTVFGPACYNDLCYQDELVDTCSGLGGTVWNSNFCIIPDYYTVIGPICWGPACFSTSNDCRDMGGTSLKWWCLVEGCDRTVMGPFCSKVPEREQCFGDDTADMCNAVGGKVFAKYYCVVDGLDYTVVGPMGFLGDAVTGDVLRFCEEVKKDVGEPFVFLESYNIANFFCVVRENIPATGPYCYGNTCFPQNATDFCDANGGKLMGNTICALPPGTRRVEGPLLYNGDILESTAPECTGLFCAIPESVPAPSVNLRCPTAGPSGNQPTGPTTGNGVEPGPSIASSRGFGFVISVLGILTAMW